MFIVSGLADRFEKGESEIVAGKSGVELAYDVLELTKSDTKRIEPGYASSRSVEYWAGWALAYYQWKTALSFRDITTHITMKEIVALYEPYHEMDIRQFVDKMNELVLVYKNGHEKLNTL